VDIGDEACFYFIKSGNARVIAPTHQHTFTQDEGVVLQCGRYINDYLELNANEDCEAVAVHFYPEVLRLIYDNELPEFLLGMEKIIPSIIDRVESSELLTNYINSLDFYFNNPSLVSDELLKLKLKELLLLLAKTDNVSIIRSLLTGVFDRQQLNFKEIVEANVYTRITLEELAQLSGLSLSSFKREFKKYYELSPAKYFKKRRLERAAKLLTNTELRVSEVAYDCGFNDVAHFSKSFQTAYGVNPSEFGARV
jgi:AraC-like DNA-binding protein